MTGLSELIPAVERLLADAERAGGSFHADQAGWHARNRIEMQHVAAELTEKHGAKIADRSDGTRITLAGITRGSTAGLRGALLNWKKAALKRMEAQSWPTSS